MYHKHIKDILGRLRSCYNHPAHHNRGSRGRANSAAAKQNNRSKENPRAHRYRDPGSRAGHTHEVEQSKGAA
jgi:hypothetical protein